MDLEINTENKKEKKFKLTIEPVLFSLVFSGALADGVITNLILRQACWYHEGLSPGQCTGEKETSAQEIVSYLEIYKTLIENIIPAFISLFVGPWSDENGRKMLLVCPLIGYSITYCIWGGLSLIKDLNPVFLLFSSLGIALSGGLCTICMGCFCYISDIASPKNIAIRLGITEAAINLGSLVGFFLSPYIFQATKNGYLVLFSTNIVILVINIIYVVFTLEESIETFPGRNKKLFRFNHLKNSYQTVKQKRPCYGRGIILLCCFTSFLSLVPIFGEIAIKFLSVIEVFKWDLHDFTLYNSILLTAIFLFSGGGLWVGKRLKLSDQLLLLGSFVLRVISSLLMAISSNPGFFYFASLLGSFRSFSGPLVRSIISSVVPQDDIGKVFSFLSSIEAVTPQSGAPIYGTIYAQVVWVNPMAIYFVSASILLAATCVMFIIIVLKLMAKRKSLQFQNDKVPTKA